MKIQWELSKIRGTERLFIDKFGHDVHRPIAKTQKLSADGKKYNKVVIFFLSVDEKRAKIWHYIGPINRPIIGRLSAGLM